MPAQRPSNIPVLTDIAAEAHEESRPQAAPTGGNEAAGEESRLQAPPTGGDAAGGEESRLQAPPTGGDAAEGEESRLEAAPTDGRDVETLIAELQTRLAASTFALTEQLMRAAFSEMEARLHEQISARLRRDLPELFDSLLREHLRDDRDP